MGRLAILVGEAGSGKSTIARGLKDAGAAVIHGDHVVHWSAVRLAPFINPGREWDWGLWKALFDNCDVRAVFRNTVVELCKSLIEDGRPIVAEACLFGLTPLRQAFVTALRDAGMTFDEPPIYWLDVPPEVLVERIAARKRRAESGIGIEEAKQRIRYFSSHISNCALRTASSEELTAAVRSHLGL